MGTRILPYLRPLADGIISNCNTKELSDLINFLCALIHKNRQTLADAMDHIILPLSEKVISFVSMKARADEDVPEMIAAQRELKTRYLAFLAALFHSELDGILLNERRKGTMVRM